MVTLAISEHTMSHLREPPPAYKNAAAFKAEELRDNRLAVMAWTPVLHHLSVTAPRNTTPPNTPTTITSHHFSLSSIPSNHRFLSPDEHPSQQIITWTPSNRHILIMMTLSILSFMVALDSCIIVTSLNVGSPIANYETKY